MRPPEIIQDTKIEMVEISQGCPEACNTCGTYNGFAEKDLRLKSLDTETIRKLIKKEISGTNLAFIDIFNKFVTTNVNSEPLRIPSFTDFAELVATESRGNAHVITISHGVRANIKIMRNRLEKITQLMKAGIIPLFILSTDFARQKGHISAEANADSYLQSLSILREALGKSRITVSLQGTRQEGSFSLARTKEMFTSILELLALNDEEKQNLTIDERSYTKTGRAEDQLDINTSEDCDVIPDAPFVDKHLPKDHKLRGMIKFDGSLVVEPNRPGKTYGDSVNPALWEKVD